MAKTKKKTRTKTKYAYKITFQHRGRKRFQILSGSNKQEAVNKFKNQLGLKRLRKGTKVERQGKWVE